MNKIRLRSKYIWELLSVFVGVSLAFSLDSWNDRRKMGIAETKALTEIRNSLKSDIKDLKDNLGGHEMGIWGCVKFRDYIRGLEYPKDSMNMAFYVMLRDYVSLQNTSAYESLKSRGLELVTDDSLRLKMIDLYDFQYQLVRKLEEDYHEAQFDDSYFHEMSDILNPYMVFNEDGYLAGFAPPLNISGKERRDILLYLTRIERNRYFLKMFYEQTIEKAEVLREMISKEI